MGVSDELQAIYALGTTGCGGHPQCRVVTAVVAIGSLRQGMVRAGSPLPNWWRSPVHKLSAPHAGFLLALGRTGVAGRAHRVVGRVRDAKSFECVIHRSALELAQANGLRSIAFPAISCGAYRFPVQRAADVAMAAVRDALVNCPVVERVIFAVRDPTVEAALRRSLATSS